MEQVATSYDSKARFCHPFTEKLATICHSKPGTVLPFSQSKLPLATTAKSGTVIPLQRNLLKSIAAAGYCLSLYTEQLATSYDSKSGTVLPYRHSNLLL